MNLLKCVFIVTIGLCSQAILHAQDWVSYQSQEKINDLIDTGEELLLATDAGLVVMNKTTLEKVVYNINNSNLSSDHLQSITQAPNGNFWIGTYDVVLAIFDGNGFTNATTPEDEAFTENTQLYDLEVAPNGDLWVGTTSGVFHKQGQNWQHYGPDDLNTLFLQAWDIEINAEGDVFVGSQNVHSYIDDVWTKLAPADDFDGYINAEIFLSQAGDLYFAGDLDRLGRFDGTEWQEYDLGSLNGAEVISFSEDPAGTIFFNTMNDGIFQLAGENLVQLEDLQTEAFSNYTSYLYIDEEGNRWLNHNVYLSVQRDGDLQTTRISPHTIEYDNVYNLHKGENGYMYFIMSSSTNSIAVVDPAGNWSSLPLPTSFALWPNLGDILVLADNDIWVATFDSLHHYDGEEWTVEAFGVFTAITADAEGKIYVLGLNRVHIIENGILSEYNTNNSPLTDAALSGHGVDTDGNLWLAGRLEGVMQKVATDGSWTTYTGAEYPVIDSPAGDIHFDQEGNLWIRSRATGAIKFDGQTWTNPILDNMGEIVNPTVFAVTGDANGTMYFAHQYGVTTLSDGEWGNLNIAHLPIDPSFNESNVEFDDAGTLWWASELYGVFSYTPETTTSTFSSAGLTANFSVYPNPVEEYTTLRFTTEDRVHASALLYNQLGQTMLQLDFGSLPAGTFQEQLNLGQLPKGLYTLQLRINNTTSAMTVVVQ